MITYIIRRLLWVGVLMFVITLLTFIIFSVLPSGDPAVQRAGRQPTEALIESIRVGLGLDKSKPAQFVCYIADVAPFIKNVEKGGSKCNPTASALWIPGVLLFALGIIALLVAVQRRRADLRPKAIIAAGVGLLVVVIAFLPSIDFSTEGKLGMDFGYSYQGNNEVLPQILDRLPTTIFLATGGVILWLAIGIPVGIISAVKTGSLLDRIAMGGALVAISAPVYFLGLAMLFLLADDIGRFKLLPGNSAFEEADTFFGKVGGLIMPWFVLAAAFAAVYARFLRGNLIDVLNEDYIRTARAKGLSERVVVFKHGVRSAITPIVTLLGLDVGILLGGAILTETVFNIQGLGRYAFDAINRSDLPTIQGVVLFGAFFIAMMSLIVDIVYAFIDPRVRYS